MRGTAADDITQIRIKFAVENALSTTPGRIDIEDYESFRQKLGLVVIWEYIQGIPEKLTNRKVEDLALIPVIVTNDRNGTGVIKLRKELLEMWGVTARDVLAEAKENAPKSMLPVFKRMGGHLSGEAGPGLCDRGRPGKMRTVRNQQ